MSAMPIETKCPQPLLGTREALAQLFERAAEILDKPKADGLPMMIVDGLCVLANFTETTRDARAAAAVMRGFAAGILAALEDGGPR